MTKAYEFAIKLRDMFSPAMMRLATVYDQQVSRMERGSSRVAGMMNGASQKVGALRAKLAGLNTRFSPKVDSGTIEKASSLSGGLRGMLGKLTGKVKVDSSDLDKADRKAGGLMSKLKGLMGGGALMGGLIGGGMAGMVMGAAEMAIQSIGHIQEMTIGAAQRSESTMFNMGELMGKQVSTSIVAAIDKYAPEKRVELMESTQKLAGSGVAPEKMMDTLTTLNNISALTNTNVSELAYIQSKIKATGYLQGDEMDMFRERGINLNPYIAKVMGIAEDQIKKAQSNGQITYEVFEKALQAYAGKGGKFEGVYERKRDSTVEGKEAALSGKWAMTLEALGKKFLPLKESIIDLLSKLVDVAGPVFSFLASLFEKIWLAIRPVWDGILGLIGYFGDLMQSGGILNHVLGVMGVMLDIILGAVHMVATAIGWLIDSAVTKLIIGIWGAVKAWGFLNAIMAANPIVAVLTAVLALVAGVMYAWETFDGFRESVIYSWAAIKSVFGSIAEFLGKLFTLDFAGALAVLGRTISSAGAAGRAAVVADRRDRRREREILDSAQGAGGLGFDKPTEAGAGGGSLGDAAGLNSTVGNSKSNSITINIGSLIAKSEISVMDLKEGIDDIESKLIDALLRVANSGARAVQA